MKLKLLNKYTYKVPKEVYIKTYNQTNLITDLNIIEDNYIFYSNTRIDSFEEFRENNYSKLIKKFVIPHLVLIISFIAIIYCFISNPYIIRKVDFKEDSIKDQTILDDVLRTVKQNDYLFKKLDLNDMSSNLMLKYPHYSWIGLMREAGFLYLDIKISDVTTKKFNNNTFYGDLISKYDAYIRHIEVKQGHLVSEINQIVKKGDLIVSGNLNYTKNQPKDILVSPQAIVLGEVIEKYTFNISRIHEVVSFTGNFNKNIYFEIFKNKIKYPGKVYDKSNIILNEKFNLLGFKIIESLEYELGKDIFVYTKDSTLEYVYSMIQYQLEKNRINPLEKIIEIHILDIVELKNEFIINVMTREYKNILVFRQFV